MTAQTTTPQPGPGHSSGPAPRPAPRPGPRTGPSGAHAEATIDLGAIRDNTRVLRRAAGEADLMAVVKADGYGHGAGRVARAALDGGAAMLGVATPSEAVALRADGIGAPLAAWLWTPTDDIRPAVAAGVQIGVSSRDHLRAVTAAAHLAPASADAAEGTVPIHLKVDTGLGRNGVMPHDLGDLLGAIADAERAGAVQMVGIMSHLACADIRGDASVPEQTARFGDAIASATAAGLRPRWRHLANTAATLLDPATRLTLVRCGIGLYGLSPVGDAAGLRPAMTLRARVALVKPVPAGQGVGYGLTYHTSRAGKLALIPLGYGDGIPRRAGNIGQVWVAGKRYAIAGRIAMDQFVIDVGDDDIAAGDEVLVFGPGDRGEPTAADWASWCDTIHYEIVTRIAPRVPRRYVGG